MFEGRGLRPSPCRRPARQRDQAVVEWPPLPDRNFFTRTRRQVPGAFPMRLLLCRIITAIAFTIASVGIAAAQQPRFIVKFRAGQAAAGQAALRNAGAQVVLTLGPQNAVAAHIPAAALQALARNGSIDYIEIDQPREPYAWSNVAAGTE